MRGIYFFKKTCDNIFFNIRIKTVIYKIDDDLFLLAGHSHRFIFPISVMVHFRIFIFASVTIAITSGPSGRVGRLVGRPCCRP
jgi:hypothetical protein